MLEEGLVVCNDRNDQTGKKEKKKSSCNWRTNEQRKGAKGE